MRNLPTGGRRVRAELRFALHGQLTPSNGPHESFSPANAFSQQGWRNEV